MEIKNELMLFCNDESSKVRCLKVDDTPWFVAADIYGYFGLSNVRTVLGRLYPWEKGVKKVYTGRGLQNVNVVNESGMYHLLFLISPEKARGKGNISEEEIQNRTDKLRRFHAWVTGEVLPSIRKYGSYSVNDAAINNKLETMKKEIINELKSEFASIQNAVYPSVVGDDNQLYGIREAAKLLDITPMQLTYWMYDCGYTERNGNNQYVPTAKSINNGLLKAKVFKPQYSNKMIPMQYTRLTSTGVNTFMKELKVSGKNRTNLRKTNRKLAVAQ